MCQPQISSAHKCYVAERFSVKYSMTDYFDDHFSREYPSKMIDCLTLQCLVEIPSEIQKTNWIHVFSR